MKIRIERPAVQAALFLIMGLCASLAAAQNLDPTRFENTILAFEAQDAKSPPPEGAILLTGSSSIARWNDQAKAALAQLSTKLTPSQLAESKKLAKEWKAKPSAAAPAQNPAKTAKKRPRRRATRALKKK